MLEAPFSPSGWHPATQEVKEEVVFLSLFLPGAAKSKTQQNKRRNGNCHASFHSSVSFQ